MDGASRTRLVSADELAKILGISRSHVFEMAARGLIPHFKIGRSVRFSVADVLEAVRQDSAAIRGAA